MSAGMAAIAVGHATGRIWIAAAPMQKASALRSMRQGLQAEGL